jgi:hypothetical protein
MKNTYSHIYLYAKGHYQRKNVIEDLKILLGHICGYSPELLSKNDVCHYLTKIAFQHLNDQFGDPLTAFRDFVFDLNPEKCWKVGYWWKKGNTVLEPYDFETAVIHKCLSIIGMTNVKEGGKVFLELDEPNPDLLPLTKEIKK